MNKLNDNILFNKIDKILKDEKKFYENNKKMIENNLFEEYLDIYLVHLFKYKFLFSNNKVKEIEEKKLKSMIRASSIILIDRNIEKYLYIEEVKMFHNKFSKNSKLFLIICNVVFYIHKYARANFDIAELYNYFLTKVNYCEDFLSEEIKVKVNWNRVTELFDSLGLVYNLNEVEFINKMANFNDEDIIRIGKVLSLSKMLIDDFKDTFLIEFNTEISCPFYEHVLADIKEDYGCFETFSHFSIFITVNNFKNKFIEMKIKKYKKLIKKF